MECEEATLLLSMSLHELAWPGTQSLLRALIGSLLLRPLLETNLQN